jgi:hypothetical protein
VVVPLFFAGSGSKLAAVTRIGGLDVGGLSPAEAMALLLARAKRLEKVPVTFTAAGKRFQVTARTVGVKADWSAAVDEAMDHAGGFGIVRGYRRLGLELFPQ